MKNLAACASLALLALAGWTVQAPPAGIVLSVEGSVEVSPRGGASVPAAVGTRLSGGDRVVPASGGRAVVILRGGERVEVTGDPYAVPVPSARAGDGDIFGRAVQVLGRVAASNTEDLADRQGLIRPIPGEPVLVAPRNELAVLDARPTFTWHRVAGAEGYTLQIRRPGAAPRRFGTEDTTWTWPGDLEPLTRGEEYWWTVAPAASGRATREQRFTVLGPEGREQVHRDLQVLADGGLDPAGDGAFLAAALYSHAGLYYEAARALERLERSGTPMGAGAYLLQGDVLATIGDLAGARRAFQRADELRR